MAYTIYATGENYTEKTLEEINTLRTSFRNELIKNGARYTVDTTFYITSHLDIANMINFILKIFNQLRPAWLASYCDIDFDIFEGDMKSRSIIKLKK